MLSYINKKVGTLLLVLAVLCSNQGAFAQMKVNLGVSLRYARPNKLSQIGASQTLIGINKDKHNFNLFYMNNVFNHKQGGVGFEYGYTVLAKKKFEVTVEPEVCFWFTPIRYNLVSVGVPGDPGFYNKNAISSTVGFGLEYLISPKIRLKAGGKFGWCYSYNDDEYNKIYKNLNLPKKYSDIISSFYYHFQVGLVTKF